MKNARRKTDAVNATKCDHQDKEIVCGPVKCQQLEINHNILCRVHVLTIHKESRNTDKARIIFLGTLAISGGYIFVSVILLLALNLFLFVITKKTLYRIYKSKVMWAFDWQFLNLLILCHFYAISRSTRVAKITAFILIDQ